MRSGNSDEIASGPSGSSYVASVRELVRTLLPHGYPSVARTAAALGASVRTLQRRLLASGISYGRIVEEVRLDKARQLLEETTMPLHDIATALGYSQPASLSRLVARNTGKPPSALRKELQRL